MLEGKIVLITGASAGIGQACAEAFAAEGCRLILAARRRSRLEKVSAAIGVHRRTECHLLELDVRDRAAVDAAIGALPAAWSAIDILVNNAGLSRGLDRVQEGSPQDWEEMIDTNVKGLLWVSRAVLPGMVARDRGHVINIGSIAGHQVYTGGSVYCASKHAERALNQGMRLDLMGTRVRVSTVDPGMVETDFSLVRFRGDRERADAVYRHFPPLQPQDIAEAVVWCAARPPHVNVQELLIMPIDQAAVYASHERGVRPGGDADRP
jgi:3-hydroxy acid dehydrogenase/malonic semialdehyde reductase